MVIKNLLWAPLSSTEFSKNTSTVLDNENDEITLRDHQKVVSNYLNIDSPYRGLLLYHGLGSGKTRTAINLAEKFKIERKIVVFLPGPALEENFIQELEKFDESYYPKNKYWIMKYNEDKESYWSIDKTKTESNFSKLTKRNQKQIVDHIRTKIDENYTIIRYNGISVNKLENCIESKILDNKFVIVDESHNIISMITNYLSEESNETSNIKGRLFWKLFMNSKNTKFVFLSGTPILNYPKELSAVFNILQGPKILYNYRITTKLNSNELIENMRKYPYAEHINIRNEIIEIIPTPKNFKLENNFLIKDYNSPSNHSEWLEHLKKYVKNLNNNSYLKTDDRFTKILNCFPLDENFDKAFIRENSLINKEVFLRRIIGFVSYYNDVNYNKNNNEYFPRIKLHKIDELEMTETQYVRYEKARIKEIKQDAKKAQRKLKIFEDDGTDITTYRSRSLAVCNFAFPLSMDVDQFILEEKQNTYKKYIRDLGTKFLLVKNEKELEKMFKELSPKYTKIINRIENSVGTNSVYSHLRNREGLNALFEMLKRKGWKKLDIKIVNNEWNVTHNGSKTYCIYENTPHKEYIKHIFNNELSEIPVNLRQKLPQTNLNGEIIKALFITASGSEGITLRNVRHLHIVEHHWSNIRLEQVIGRVNRFNSHIDLPYEERTVDIYKYVTIFGEHLKTKFKSSKNNNFENILYTDKGFTSDECVINVANRKQLINNELLSCLKEASIDCFKNIDTQCYQLNNNSYHPDFEKHLLDSKINIAPKIKLKKIRLSEKKWIPEKYHSQIFLYDEKNNIIYDQESVRKGFPKKIAKYIKKIKFFKVIID